MPVALQQVESCPRALARALWAEAEALLALCGLERWELSLVITDDKTIRSLNRRFRKKDKPTDVLSFPQLEASELRAARARLRRNTFGKQANHPPYLLGDIVISLDTARRQASRLQIALPLHMRKLLIHGFLHLLGYDHEKSLAEAQRMFARERVLWNKLRQLN